MGSGTAALGLEVPGGEGTWLVTRKLLNAVATGELTALRRADVTFSPGGCAFKRELLKCVAREDLYFSAVPPLSSTPAILGS